MEVEVDAVVEVDFDIGVAVGVVLEGPRDIGPVLDFVVVGVVELRAGVGVLVVGAGAGTVVVEADCELLLERALVWEVDGVIREGRVVGVLFGFELGIEFELEGGVEEEDFAVSAAVVEVTVAVLERVPVRRLDGLSLSLSLSETNLDPNLAFALLSREYALGGITCPCIAYPPPPRLEGTTIRPWGAPLEERCGGGPVEEEVRERVVRFVDRTLPVPAPPRAPPRITTLVVDPPAPGGRWMVTLSAPQ